MSSMESIQDFLGQKRFAMIGVSRQPQDFSRSLFREFLSRGYDAVPVNPDAGEVEGRPCFHTLQEVQPPVDSVLFMTSPSVTAQLVQECAAAGVKRVWMFRGAGQGAVDADAVQFCESKGITVIPGECPFMFLPGKAWFHGVHGFIRKLRGSYPE